MVKQAKIVKAGSVSGSRGWGWKSSKCIRTIHRPIGGAEVVGEVARRVAPVIIKFCVGVKIFGMLGSKHADL